MAQPQNSTRPRHHDHIHHRLIHSVETSSVGRSIAMAIAQWLLDQEILTDPEQKHAMAGAVQAACVAHDIGNPPFGHSGEAAIGEWFSEKFSKTSGMFGALGKDKWREFIEFEGNAQGFRILTNLEMYRNDGGMRLSFPVLGAFQKYPLGANAAEKQRHNSKAASEPIYCGAKKFGVFQSDLESLKVIGEKMGMVQCEIEGEIAFRRHPLVFIVEAADDICYNLLDLEDAYTSGDLSAQEVERLLLTICGKPNRDLSSYTPAEKISYYRARAIGVGVQQCVDAFKKNYITIMDGTFNSSLLEECEKWLEFEKIKDLSKERIFKSKRKTELEVSGRNVIHKVLDGVAPIYQTLSACNWEEEKLSGYEEKVVRALNLDLRTVRDEYSALHSMTDFVSGMTDRYCVSIAKLLS